jgi:hypothetical protein
MQPTSFCSAAPSYGSIALTDGATSIANPLSGPLAISFNGQAGAVLTDLKFLMNRSTATDDGGIVTVWLVPVSGGTGSAAGQPNGGSLFTGKIQLGTIADGALTYGGAGALPPQLASIIDLPVSQALPTSGEWWIGFTSTTTAAKLVFDNGYSGIGQQHRHSRAE